MDVRKIYEENYQFHIENLPGAYRNKYNWAATEVFDLTTYDDNLDHLFVEKIVDVCKAILDGQTFEYIGNKDRYVTYILVCQLLDKFHWIEWGTSIRGAWFEEQHGVWGKSKDILNEQEWSSTDNTGAWVDNVIEKVPFTVDNLKILIEFLEEVS